MSKPDPQTTSSAELRDELIAEMVSALMDAAPASADILNDAYAAWQDAKERERQKAERTYYDV